MTRFKKMLIRKDDKGKVVNYMGGVSFGVSPLEALKLVASSSMFMEPKYYQKEVGEEDCIEISPLVRDDSVFKLHSDVTPSRLTIRCIADALEADFGGTLRLAVELRQEYMVRVVPQLIMVMAAGCPARVEFDEKNPGEFRRLNLQVMQRAVEPAVQLACWLFLNDMEKKGIPSLLKRSWKDRVGKWHRR